MVTALAGLGVGLAIPVTLRGQDRVSARLDPDRVVLGATIDLVVSVQPDGFRSDIDDPDLPTLPNVLLAGTAREARVRITNGRVTRHTVFRFTLRPLVAGPLTIPPVRVVVNGRPRFTRALRLDVQAVSAGGVASIRPAGPRGEPLADPRMPPPGGTPGIFAVTRVDRAAAWVGEQVTLTFAFYHDPTVPLLESPDYAPPASPGFWRIELDPEPAVSAERIGNRTYHVQRFRYALFPLRPGVLVIQPATVRVVEPDPERWWAAGATRTITTEPLNVESRALPAGAPAGFDGTEGRYDLAGGLRSDRGMVGVPLSLDLTVSGAGNPTPIGPPVLPAWPDVETHPPSVESATDLQAGRVSGRKAFRFLLVPREAGPLGLGVAQLPYFDPATGAYAVDTLRLGEIQIAAAPAGALTRDARHAPTGPTLWPARVPRAAASRNLAEAPWYWVALAGPWLAWLGVLGAERARQRDGPASQRRAARRALTQARLALQRGTGGAEREAAAAIAGALAARYGVRANRGAVYPSAADLVGAGVPPAVAAAATAAWSTLVAAGYGGQTRETAADAVARFEALLGSGRRQRGGARGARSTGRWVKRRLLVISLGASASIAAGLSGAAPQVTLASRWQAANQAYRAGEFSASATSFRELLRVHDDPHLQANLAAALWRGGERGAALRHYRMALGRAPRNQAIRADYRRLRAELHDPPDGLTTSSARLARLRLDELLGALLAASLATWAAAVAAHRAQRPRSIRWARGLRAAGLLGVLALAALTSAHARTVGRPPLGVVARPAGLAAAPGGPAFATLPEGSVAVLRGRSGGSWRVRAQGYPAGWVAADLILPLD